MPKKIIKLFQSSVPKFCRQNIFMYDRGKKDFKYRMPEYEKSKKENNASCKNSFKRKQRPKGTLLTIFRYLSVSINANFNGYPKIALFWKTLFSRLLKERISKTTLAALNDAANNAIAPIVRTKTFKATVRTTSDPVEPSSTDQPKKRKKFEKQSTETPPPRPIKEFNGVEEQQFYTEEPSRKNLFFNLKARWQELEEIPSNELPPPQKCRLSCPLPPPEFCSYEINEFHSNYHSPTVRFSSLPMQFLPESKQEEERPLEGPTQLSSTDAVTEVTSSSSGSLSDLGLGTMIENSRFYDSVTPSNTPSFDSLTRNIPKMKALLFEPMTLKLKYDVVDAPIKIFKDEVLVQVAYSGVCDTDLLITEGRVSCRDRPIILGHEISGRVYAVGKEVDHVLIGDKIVVNAYTACCFCRYCSRGLFSCCLNEGLNNSIGVSKDGGWAEFVVVKKSQVHKIPDQLELNQAALIQPLSCVLSAMSKLKILHEMDILVLGLGVSGCLWASILHSQGYKNVFVCDNTPKRRSQFESLGTSYSSISPEEIGRYNMDLVVECTGSPNSIERSLNVLNPSGQICFFRKPRPVTEVRCMPYEIIEKEITIVGNSGNAFHFSRAINMANALGPRYLDFEKLGVKIFDLENFREAFAQKKSEEVSKIIFKLDS